MFQVVETSVFHRCVEIASEACVNGEGFPSVPEPDENILHDSLCSVEVIEKALGKKAQRFVERTKQRGERLHIAAAYLFGYVCVRVQAIETKKDRGSRNNPFPFFTVKKVRQ